MKKCFITFDEIIDGVHFERTVEVDQNAGIVFTPGFIEFETEKYYYSVDKDNVLSITFE